jgi:translocation and assembly module TamA
MLHRSKGGGAPNAGGRRGHAIEGPRGSCDSRRIGRAERIVGRRGAGVRALVAAALLAVAGAAPAQEGFGFRVLGDDKALIAALEAASALRAARAEDTTEALDLYAAARAEYGRLLAALYAAGYYSGVVSVTLDGREAAEIAPLDVPARIGRVRVLVDPGPPFVFGTAEVAPLAGGTAMPPGFAPGRPARSGEVQAAVDAGIDGWRARGHAKASVAGEDIVADHAARRLSARVRLDPGPKLRFGKLRVSGYDRMRLGRILAIAGLPEGQTFRPATLEKVEERLRRTGVFRSVAITEDAAVRAPDFVDLSLALAEEKPRRYTFGAELSSLDGVTLSGSWLHRNLFGGAERLEIKGEIAQIGAQTSGADYRLGVTLDRPATFTPDTTVGLAAAIAHLDEADYTSDTIGIGLTATQYVSRRLTLRGGLTYRREAVTDASGDYTYTRLALPLGASWDSRDKPLDARDGHFIDVELLPFAGFDGAESGVRLVADARIFRSFGADDGVTLAGRLQLGRVWGPTLLGTPREDLFYSGGGGTVRGFPYQSLGVPLLKGVVDVGGQAFLGASAEARVRVTDTIGVVAFADWGQVGALEFGDDLGGEQLGAGLGLRYDVGFAPLRLDVAAPVSGEGGKGVQVYIGIGQAF